MKLEEIILQIEKTLLHNGYTLEDLISVLCDCYDSEEDTDTYDNTENKEEKQLKIYNDRIKRITDLEDETEKTQELKRLLKELEDKYKGNNPSKQIKKLYSHIKKLLNGGKGNNKPNNRPI